MTNKSLGDQTIVQSHRFHADAAGRNAKKK